MLKPVLFAVSAVWIAFDLWLVAFRGSGASAEQTDVGTLTLLNLAI